MPCASSVPSVRKPEPYSGILSFSPAAAQSLTNLTAPPPAKNTNTASGLSDATSVISAWNSTFGNGRLSSFTTLPPLASNASLKPLTDCSPAAYFQVSVTTFFRPRSPSTWPMA